MATGSNEDQFVFCQPVKEKPIRFHVAVPMAHPIPAQRMRPTSAGQLLLSLEVIHDRLQFIQVFALLSDAPQISFESSCGEKAKGHQICSRSSRNER